MPTPPPPLIIRHLASSPLDHLKGTECSDRFQLDLDGRVNAPVVVPAASGYPVEGRPQDDLMSELRWYLEDFLEYPFPPETDHAERVLRALDGWANEVYDALFSPEDATLLLDSVQQNGDGPLRLQVRSADPRVLSWPWESLLNLDAVSNWSVERSVDGLDTPLVPVDDLPRARVNILLVTCRPKEQDVGFRSISRPLVELIHKEELPVDVHVLRPPTFERLQAHLAERPRHYHIFHFDGHGEMNGEGQLIFEDDICSDDAIEANEFSDLLRKYGIPIVVLNACQSGTQGKTAFASVATSLLQAGTRSVVAMAYSLRVSGAVEFLPDFYRGFFASGDIGTGMRRGRTHMHEEKARVCVRGRFDLEDWLVPVLYQQHAAGLPFGELRPGERKKLPTLDLGKDLPNAFVGRDGAILQLERAMRGPEAGILVHGLAGAGKTALVSGFVRWLAQTEGLDSCVWLAFNEVPSAEHVLDRLATTLFGSQIQLSDAEQKVQLIAQGFGSRRCVVVWDGFDVVAGTIGVEPTLSRYNRSQLRALLLAMRGGLTKIVITSRGTERWLEPALRAVPLSRLRGEELWAFCKVTAEEMGAEIDYSDPEFGKLVDVLAGHPFSLKSAVAALKECTSGELSEALQSNVAQPLTREMHASLSFDVSLLDREKQLLLIPLALHQGIFVGEIIKLTAEEVSDSYTTDIIDEFFQLLASAGFIHEVASNGFAFEIHPVLLSVLRASLLEENAYTQWHCAYLRILGEFSQGLPGLEASQRRKIGNSYGLNIRNALKVAQETNDPAQVFLLRALGKIAEDQQKYDEALRFYGQLAELYRATDDHLNEATAYHCMGVAAQATGDLDTAERWLNEALLIAERIGYDVGVAATYHHLGVISEERGDYAESLRLLHRSLELAKVAGDQSGVQANCSQFGALMERIEQFGLAEGVFSKSLKDAAERGDTCSAARAQAHLGIIAIRYDKIDVSERHFLRSLDIFMTQGDAKFAKNIHYWLGYVAEIGGDFKSSESWYKKYLNSPGAPRNSDYAGVYRRLGVVAKKRQDDRAAEQWFRKAIQVETESRDELGLACSYGELAILEGERFHFKESGNLLIKSAKLFMALGRVRELDIARVNYVVLYRQAPSQEQASLRELWDSSGLTWPGGRFMRFLLLDLFESALLDNVIGCTLHPISFIRNLFSRRSSAPRRPATPRGGPRTT